MSKSEAKKKHPMMDLMISIVIPSVILMKFSDVDSLGPVNGLLLALAFPCVYFVYEFLAERQTNVISILGIISVLLTGGIGLLALDPHWIAVKEAAVPGLIGLLVLGSLKTKFPLVRKLIYNDQLIDTDLVAESLKEHDNQVKFDRLLVITSYLLASSFFLSSLLNYVLAKVIVVTSPSVDQVKFNEEIGQMTMLSYPVIVLPSTVVMGIALWLLLRGIKDLTGLNLESIFRAPPAKETK